jgi:hypothetical protein
MSNYSCRVAELFQQGDTCGHILAKLALEAQGRQNPDLARAMSGLELGMGQGFNCGALTGGCCILGLYGGRADKNEKAHPHFDLMIEEFAGWFEAEMGDKFGGINCEDIMNFDPARRKEYCPGVILECWLKIKEILAKHRVNVEKPAPAKCGED